MISAIYSPWRSSEFPRSRREIVAFEWTGGGGLRVEIAETFDTASSLALTFALPRAIQAIDEGYRLRDIAIGDALIYFAGASPYLAAFRANAATTMDNFPLVHWMIVSCNQCVDVLSELEPVVLRLI